MVHFHNFHHMKINWFPPLVLGVCDSSSKEVPLESHQVSRVPSGGGGGRIAVTASTTDSESCCVRAALSFVARDVFATLTRVGRSRLDGCLNVSKNWGTTVSAENGRTIYVELTASASFLAMSNPAAMTDGCTPSEM
jgi:hypothetical protein